MGWLFSAQVLPLQSQALGLCRGEVTYYGSDGSRSLWENVQLLPADDTSPDRPERKLIEAEQ